MAFYARKVGWSLWNKLQEFDMYGFCICCKEECAPGEKGHRSKKGKLAERSFLCSQCGNQWKDTSGPLYKIARFKIE